MFAPFTKADLEAEVDTILGAVAQQGEHLHGIQEARVRISQMQALMQKYDAIVESHTVEWYTPIQLEQAQAG